MQMTKCNYPRCKSSAKYCTEVLHEETGEYLRVDFCKIHYNALLVYNDDKDDWHWNKLTEKEKRRVTQIVYRWRKA